MLRPYIGLRTADKIADEATYAGSICRGEAYVGSQHAATCRQTSVDEQGFRQDAYARPKRFTTPFQTQAKKSFSGDGVVAGAAPGMAAAYAPQGEPRAFQGAVLPQCLHGVLAACRRVAAGGGQVGRHGPLVKPHRKHEKLRHKPVNPAFPHRRGNISSPSSPGASSWTAPPWDSRRSCRPGR